MVVGAVYVVGRPVVARILTVVVVVAVVAVAVLFGVVGEFAGGGWIPGFGS